MRWGGIHAMSVAKYSNIQGHSNITDTYIEEHIDAHLAEKYSVDDGTWKDISIKANMVVRRIDSPQVNSSKPFDEYQNIRLELLFC